MIRIYHQKNDNIYYVKEECYCNHCGIELAKTLAVVYAWRKKDSEMMTFCLKCVNKAPIMADVTETKIVIRVPVIPQGAIPVMPFSPQLTDSSNKSCFEMANMNVSGEMVYDNTRVAGRESWSGSSIGAPDMQLLESKDSPASKEEAIQILQARPIKLMLEGCK